MRMDNSIVLGLHCHLCLFCCPGTDAGATCHTGLLWCHRCSHCCGPRSRSCRCAVRLSCRFRCRSLAFPSRRHHRHNSGRKCCGEKALYFRHTARVLHSRSWTGIR
uniref:Putative secreted protein n=1 Tax=Ixodes ricinus TaxID=34613 RepID=A0A6B0UHL5_IXORI